MTSESREEMLSYLIGALADGSIYYNQKNHIYRIKYYQKSKLYLQNCIESRIYLLFNKRGYYYLDKRKSVYHYEITSKEF